MSYTRQMMLYLHRLYERNVEEKAETKSGALALEAGVRTPSAIDIIRRLEEKGFVSRTPWGPIILTEKGLKEASRLIYRHRIIETYLTMILNLDVEEACEEATSLELQMGDKVVYAMCDKLGHPCRCIHGKNIPHMHGDEKD
ncbi:MAG: metal-dependent transcriptional regulator [Nitrososphaeria archaeon]